jgi:hypothetical protein
MEPTNIPYRCEKCMTPGACGFNGILVNVDKPAPLCKHNEPPGKPCHGKPERMYPSPAQRRKDLDLLYSGMFK